MISTSNIDDLIPDFLLESDHFQTILLDVEGNLMSTSKSLDSHVSAADRNKFVKHLDAGFADHFEETVDMLLAAPKEKRQVVLAFSPKNNQKSEPIWWEFSTIINSEMDLIGIIGIGVNAKFLEQEIPWNSLVDLLEFGKLMLDEEFRVLDFDQKVTHWLGIRTSDAEGKGEIFLSELPLKLKKLSQSTQPTCLVLTDEQSGIQFSALLIKINHRYQLYILPKARKKMVKKIQKPFTPAHLATFPGAVWVINKDLEFVQLNQFASDTTFDWAGREGVDSFKFIFNSELKSLERLKLYFSKAFDGNAADFELKINPSDSQSSFWYIGVRPIVDEMGLVSLIAVHGVMLTQLSKRLSNLESENKSLKELVMKPSYILRSPLSSMLGLLDLIDPQQLDQENQKYFSYLKPLAKELDEVIRTNAKRISAFD